MRLFIRKIIPASLLLQRKLLLNRWKNTRYTKEQNWAQPAQEQLAQQDIRTVNQLIKKTSRSDNKVHNMHLAIKNLNGMYLAPQQVFSFWQAVGQASRQRGYKSGRNLINGVLTEDYGGGLCQLAGIIYHTALLSSLEVVERHAHSVDIYEEQERYTPLGADATVVYGYKDLKLRNPYAFPVQFFFSLDANELSCSFIGPQIFEDIQIDFVRSSTEKGWQVRTERKTIGNVVEILAIFGVSKDIYGISTAGAMVLSQ